jgi:hypothetical protein
VALKFLPAHRLKSSSWRNQFFAEVRMARQVSHRFGHRQPPVIDLSEITARTAISGLLSAEGAIKQGQIATFYRSMTSSGKMGRQLQIFIREYVG